MKFKVGDIVKVRSWDAMEEEFGLDDGNINNTDYCFTEGMTKYCGNYVIIDSCSDDCYTIKEDNHNWSWTDDMFEEKEDKLFGVDVVYNVNEDKRTVACYFKCPVCMKQEDVWEDIIDEMYNNLHTPFEISHYAVMNKTISEYPKKFGLAKCLADDIFDVEEGKRIAKRQLRDRINRCKLNFLDKMIVKLEHETSSFFDREDSLYEKIYQSVSNYKKEQY